MHSFIMLYKKKIQNKKKKQDLSIFSSTPLPPKLFFPPPLQTPKQNLIENCETINISSNIKKTNISNEVKK